MLGEDQISLSSQLVTLGEEHFSPYLFHLVTLRNDQLPRCLAYLNIRKEQPSILWDPIGSQCIREVLILFMFCISHASNITHFLYKSPRSTQIKPTQLITTCAQGDGPGPHLWCHFKDIRSHKWVHPYKTTTKIAHKWTHVNPSEPKCTQVNPSELKVNPRKPKWIQVNPSELKWTKVNPSEHKGTRVNPSEPKWTHGNQSELNLTQVQK